jgi:hypothetical protein
LGLYVDSATYPPIAPIDAGVPYVYLSVDGSQIHSWAIINHHFTDSEIIGAEGYSSVLEPGYHELTVFHKDIHNEPYNTKHSAGVMTASPVSVVF